MTILLLCVTIVKSQYTIKSAVRMVTIFLDKPNKLPENVMNPVSGFVYFPYNEKILELVKQRPSRVYLPNSKEWEIPYRDVAPLAELLSEISDVQIEGTFIDETKLRATALPEGFTFKTKPYAHQIDTLLFGTDNKSFLLGDDQGAGKTKQIIDLYRLHRFNGKVKRCLVICCVNGNKYNWYKEVKIHSEYTPWILGTRQRKRNRKEYIGSSKDRLEDLQHLPDNIHFVITNIETLRLDSYTERKGSKTVTRFPIAERLRELCLEGEFGIVAIDEVHKNKNPDAAQSRAAMLIDDEHKIPMSGTFLLNSPFDFYFALKWSGFETHSFWQFKHMYGRYCGTELVGYKNLDMLNQFVEPVMLRRMKEDIMDLPPKVRSIEYVELGTKQRKVYDAVLQQLRSEIDKVRLSPDPLSQLLRLRQATGAPSILKSDCKDSVKLNRCMELIQEEIDRGGKVIVFSNWTSVLEPVQEACRALAPSIITGNVKQEDRFPLIDRFQNDETDLCIGTIGALGTGFTLNKATMVIFMDEPWNRALKDQAEDRAHRIGTKRPVSIVTLIAIDTVDEHVHDVVEQRGAMADFVVDGKLDVNGVLNQILGVA